MDPQTFGRYRIVRKLAGGGMGRVFLAWNPELNQNVGLKLIDTGHDQESLDVVAAERCGANLQDQLAKNEPGGRVARIFDVGEREGYFFVAMEYVEGEDLSELVARGPIDPERAVRIAIDILEVLSRAHNFETVIDGHSHRGIIHGDIKPRNIRITPDGQVKVLDFGIAKAVSMTRSITFNQYGSVPYSSPERVRTGDVDARSDVWSVAVVLFEMLTGRAYFTADTSARLEVKIRDYAMRSRDLTALPPGLRDILARALDPEFARRFPSASAFDQALKEWSVGGKAALLEQDPDATRRTARAADVAEEVGEEDPQATRRPGPVPLLVLPPPRRPAYAELDSDADAEPHARSWSTMGRTALMTLVGVFSLMYAAKLWNHPAGPVPTLSPTALTKPGMPETSVSPVAARPVKSSSPFIPAGHAASADYASEADRIIADYRNHSPQAPDWQRAQTAVLSALSLAPDDPGLRGKSQIIDGHVKLAAHDVKGAQTAFEEATTLLPQSPDPGLGLMFTFIAAGDPGKAEDALNEAKNNGFEPGPREQRALANSYRKRGEYWMADARKAHAMSRMVDSLKRASSDLTRSRDLYSAAAPFPGSTALIASVTLDRDHALRVLAQVRRMKPAAKTQLQARRIRAQALVGSPSKVSP